jgi:hypothetical protein
MYRFLSFCKKLFRLAFALTAVVFLVAFLIDESPMRLLQAKGRQIGEWAATDGRSELNALVEAVRSQAPKGFVHRRPKGWFRDDTPTGINDGDTVIIDAPGARWRDSVIVMRWHKYVGKDGHYFPPDEEFDRAYELYGHSWVFDGDKVYVREGPFDKIAIIRKTSDWYMEGIHEE